MANVENKNYASKCNIDDYIHSYQGKTFTNIENKIQLNNSCLPVAKVLNVKTIQETIGVLNETSDAYNANIAKLKELRDYVALKPPIQKDGNNIALPAFDRLVDYANELKNDLAMIDAGSLESKAWTEREKNIDTVVARLKELRQQEEQWREYNKAESEKGFIEGFYDCWKDGWNGIKENGIAQEWHDFHFSDLL